MFRGKVLIFIGFLLVLAPLVMAADDWDSFGNDSFVDSDTHNDSVPPVLETLDYEEPQSGAAPESFEEPYEKYESRFYLALGFGVLVILIVGFLIVSLIRSPKNRFKK
jgi:hypothetical protein